MHGLKCHSRFHPTPILCPVSSVSPILSLPFLFFCLSTILIFIFYWYYLIRYLFHNTGSVSSAADVIRYCGKRTDHVKTETHSVYGRWRYIWTGNRNRLRQLLPGHMRRRQTRISYLLDWCCAEVIADAGVMSAANAAEAAMLTVASLRCFQLINTAQCTHSQWGAWHVNFLNVHTVQYKLLFFFDISCVFWG